MTDQPLLGKSALVTGGARRVGRAIALALAEAGADVAITFRNSRAEAAETVREIESLGRRALAVECDVRSEASVRSAVAAAVGCFGRLDLVVNNAAVFQSAPLDSLTLDQWDAVFETNARGPFLVAREALAHLRAAQGRIVNIGSLGGIKAWADPCALLRLQGRLAHAHPGHGQGLRARGERELRRPRLDRTGRKRRPSSRTFCRKRRRCSAMAAWKT